VVSRVRPRRCVATSYWWTATDRFPKRCVSAFFEHQAMNKRKANPNHNVGSTIFSLTLLEPYKNKIIIINITHSTVLRYWVFFCFLQHSLKIQGLKLILNSLQKIFASYQPLHFPDTVNLKTVLAQIKGNLSSVLSNGTGCLQNIYGIYHYVHNISSALFLLRLYSTTSAEGMTMTIIVNLPFARTSFSGNVNAVAPKLCRHTDALFLNLLPQTYKSRFYSIISSDSILLNTCHNKNI
jgi:hypothetical protein